MKKNICIIPARSRSKRIKNKNIINFFGKPVIYYPIKEAMKSKLFDKIIVSTDSKKISKLSKKYGAQVPSLRPKSLSSSISTINEVIKFCVKKYALKKYEFLFCIFPFSPLLTALDLIKAKKMIKKNKAPHLISVKRQNPLKQKIFIKKNKVIKQSNLKIKKIYKTNNIFVDNGNFFILNIREYIKAYKPDYSNTIGFEMINKDALDVNNLLDLDNAKKLFKKLKIK